MGDWTANLAYIVGLMATDGNLSKDGRHLVMVSKDIEQLQNFARVLQLKNKISPKKSSYTGLSNCFKIQFGNIKLYHFLMDIGLRPNKTKTIGRLRVPDEYFKDFLRGHLDGDGYTYSYWDKRWKSSFRLYTGFISASLDHVEWVRESVSRLFGIEGKITHQGKSIFRLIYAKTASVALLGKIYYKADLICLERKRLKIERALSIIAKEK